MEQYPDYRPPRKKNSTLKYLSIAMLGAIIGGIIVAFVSSFYLNHRITQLTKDGVLPNQVGQSGQQQIVYPEGENITVAQAVADKVMPAVVGIQAIKVTRDIFMGSKETGGIGTGVIVSPDGLILTNHHVITDNPKEITVQLKDGRELKAEEIWSNATLDLGVIKIDANNLPVAELGDSDQIKVGQMALAIGNPLGMRFERTVTSGIISALNRSIMTESNIVEDLIQTDASINPGNSGGPLLNDKGQVVGINTFKIQTGEGLGFAIPINVAKPIIDQVIKYGEFKPSILGIQGLDREIASYVEEEIEIDKGILIMDIERESGVYKAGLRQGDIITHIDGKEVNTMIQLRTALYEHLPGEEVSIKYLRNNSEKEAKITLQQGE
ncbi:trypsin-like peptidase domain-containing protein [Irregularibacter muris]|jgi:serine protease Do|uniref:Trypsin-like peptidase domain-containing protein n=1 Tax=Irregularibacter muris TaxID=1796619 RepID=A0AAE3L052_9FIRM|nr:trypsin-like peptidase domain-containing protein [Irregularibacter muris]MCR1899297.1 trypsin-like peptidase domain-containing protein [Irregularibacter muris]